jgi:hypothetical protein
LKIKNPKTFIGIATSVLLICFVLVYFRGFWWNASGLRGEGDRGPDAVISNYGKAIIESAKEFKIPKEYLAALCLLESGGQKKIPSRFEKHVYMQLKMVKLGLRKSYEHVSREHLSDAGDEALKNLASSWGPFQLMGYKCLLYNIKVKDLRGEESIYWGSKWIHETYGKFIEKKDFKSAFHIHNTGSSYPANGIARTHDPMYISNGLNWMKYFDTAKLE